METLPYDRSKSVLFLHQHHSMCDGMCMVAFTAFLNDSIEDGLFPKYKKLSFFKIIGFYLTFPIWIVLGYLQTLLVKRDPDYKNGIFYPKDGQLSGRKIFTASKIWEFKDLKIYKKFGVSFNDFVLSHVSSTIAKMFREHGKSSVKSVTCGIPVSM